MLFLIFLVLVVWVVISYVMADKMKLVAIKKGYAGNIAFHSCFWLGIIGYLFVISLPDLVQRKQLKEIISLLSKERTPAEGVNEDESAETEK